MRSLITGGAGFIGSHLADHLMKQGEEVVILDDLSTGRFDNIRHLVEKRGFKYYIGKVEDRRLLEKIVEQVYGKNFEDMNSRQPDLARAKELINYQPSRSLDTIIDDVLAFYRGNWKPEM